MNRPHMMKFILRNMDLGADSVLLFMLSLLQEGKQEDQNIFINLKIPYLNL